MLGEELGWSPPASFTTGGTHRAWGQGWVHKEAVLTGDRVGPGVWGGDSCAEWISQWTGSMTE